MTACDWQADAFAAGLTMSTRESLLWASLLDGPYVRSVLMASEFQSFAHPIPTAGERMATPIEETALEPDWADYEALFHMGEYPHSSGEWPTLWKLRYASSRINALTGSRVTIYGEGTEDGREVFRVNLGVRSVGPFDQDTVYAFLRGMEMVNPAPEPPCQTCEPSPEPIATGNPFQDAVNGFGRALAQAGEILVAQGLFGQTYKGEFEAVQTQLATLTPDQLRKIGVATIALGSYADMELHKQNSPS